MLGFWLAAKLVQGSTLWHCYSDADASNREDHCKQSKGWERLKNSGWPDIKPVVHPLEKYRDWTYDGSGGASVVLSKNTEIDYDELATGSGLYWGNPTPIYFEAIPLTTGTSTDPIELTLRTSIVDTPQRYTDPEFYGFSKVIVNNLVTDMHTNELFLGKCPSVDDLDTFHSGDDRPVHLFCPGIITSPFELGPELDVLVQKISPENLEIQISEIDSEWNGERFDLSGVNAVIPKLPTVDSLKLVLQENGLKIVQGEYSIELVGRFYCVQGNVGSIELTCDQYLPHFGGVYVPEWFNPGFLSGSIITIKGDNWKEMSSDLGCALMISASSEIIIDANACPFDLSAPSVTVKRASVYIQNVRAAQGAITFTSAIDGQQESTSDIRIGSMGTFYDSTSSISVDRVTINICEVTVGGFFDIATLAPSGGVVIDSIKISSSMNSGVSIGQIPVIRTNTNYKFEAEIEDLIMPPNCFELNRPGGDKKTFRQDILDIVDNLHKNAAGIRSKFDFHHECSPLVMLDSWDENTKKTIFMEHQESLPLAIAFRDDIVVAKSDDPEKQFKAEDWNVVFNPDQYQKVSEYMLPQYSSMYVDGEVIGGTGELKYHCKNIPESAFDLIVYTPDEKWRTSFNSFNDIVRILTPEDLDGMKDRLSPNAKNVVVFVADSVEKEIDLSSLRSDANVIVAGVKVNELVDLLTSEDEALELMISICKEDYKMQDVLKFIGKHLSSLTPTVCINIGQVQSMILLNVNYQSPIKCNTVMAVMSKFGLTTSVECESAYYDIRSYTFAAAHSFKSLVLIPFDIENGNMMSLEKVIFKASEWELQYSCSGMAHSELDICGMTKSFVLKIPTSSVSGELTTISLSKNIEYVASGDSEIRGIRVLGGVTQDMFCASLPSVPLLEDTHEIRKLASKTMSLDEIFDPKDIVVTFSGVWNTVTKINGPLYFSQYVKMSVVCPSNAVVTQALSFSSISSVKVSKDGSLKMEQPQYVYGENTITFPSASTVSFAEIVGCSNSDKSDIVQNPRLTVVVGESTTSPVIDKISCRSDSNLVVASCTVKQALVLGYGASLILGGTVEDNVELTFDYNLDHLLSDVPVLQCPTFTPSKVAINYVTDDKFFPTKMYIGKTHLLYRFSSSASCEEWKSKASYSQKVYTGTGEAVAVNLQCVEGDSGKFGLQLSFTLTGEVVPVTPPAPIPIVTTPPAEGERVEVSIQLPSGVQEEATFESGKAVTITAQPGATENIVFKDTAVAPNSQITVDAPLVLSNSLVMTGDSSIVVGSSGSIEFEATCEVSIVASGISLPRIDIGKQKNGAAVPKSLTVALDLNGVNEDDVKEAFGDEGKVLVSGYNIDGDKWVNSIKLDVTGDFKLVIKWRESSSGKLLDVKKEIYVTLDDGLSGGAIAGIVIGCIAVVAAIGFAIFYLVRRSPAESTAEEP